MGPARRPEGFPMLPLLIDRARHADPERALLALLAPEPARSAMAALLWLNAELVGAYRAASEEMVALVRFQWWREAIERAARGAASGHPALDALKAPLATDAGLCSELLALIDARERLLLQRRFDDQKAFWSFARATSGRLHRLLLGLRQDGPAAGELAWAERLGTAYGVTGLLRSAPWYARLGIAVVPEELVAPVRSLRALAAGGEEEALCRAVAMLAARAEAELAAAGGAPRWGHLGAVRVLARFSLARLRQAGWDPRRSRPGPTAGLVLRLLVVHLAG